MKYNKGPKRSPFRPRGSGVGNDKGRKVGAKGKKARVTMDAEYNRAKKRRHFERLLLLPASQLTLEKKKRSEYMKKYRAIQRKKVLSKRVLSLDRRVKVKALLVYDDCVCMMIVCTRRLYVYDDCVYTMIVCIRRLYVYDNRVYTMIVCI